ncbi:hypothetical protein GCM10009347_15200 [Shewanella algicola]|nr:hypothetical protein GCM10009347_15200 [Shewanella algicola]
MRVGHFQAPNKYESPLQTQRAFLRLEFEFGVSIFIYQNEQDNSLFDMVM